MRRPIPAVIVAALVATFGAIVLGEYDLSGYAALLAGVLFGLAIAEVVATLGRQSDRYLQAAVALITEAGMAWAIWISTGHRPSTASATAWFGTVAGMGASAWWLKSADRRAGRSQAVEAPTPGV